MQERTEITRSPGALNYQIVFFSITYVLLAILSIFILLVPFTVFDRNVLLWFLILTGAAVALYALSVYVITKSWQSNKYFLAKDCLIVTAGYSGNREDVYRYETINNVSLQQSGTEKTRGYAKLVLNISGVPQPLVLKDVIRPQEVLEALQNNIGIANRSTSGK